MYYLRTSRSQMFSSLMIFHKIKSLLSEASDSTAEQEPVEKKCKLVCVYSMGVWVYLKSSSYFTPTYHFANLCCQGFAKLPLGSVCLVFQSETRQNSPTHQALPGQKECTNRTESRGFSKHRDRTEQQIHHHR